MATSSRPHPRRVGWALGALLLAGACTGGGGSAPPTTTAPAASPTTSPTAGGTDGGPDVVAAAFTGVRLTKGSAVVDPAAPTTVVGGTPLDGAATDAVLARLPGWDATGAET